MKGFKRILKRFDLFGISFIFKYQNEDKYSTSLGGFFSIAYSLLVLLVGIYYFIPFFRRKNFSIVYYSINLSSTEQINLKKSKTAFSVGLECDIGQDGTKVEDILNLSFQYVIYTKTIDGKTNKTKINLSAHPCNYSDFYYYYNDSLDRLNMNTFFCLDKMDNNIEGIYTDEVFTYYKFTVSSKEDSFSNYKKIDDYLSLNDCNVQLYYSDYIIDLDNYREPIQPLLNSKFIPINPTVFLKMNIFFMNQYFENDNSLFFVFNEEEPTLKTSFSRYEEYFLYKGLNRYITKPSQYEYYTKIYLRADTKKTIIKRKYQKLIEFYADSSSLLIGLFEVLYIIFNFINSFYASHSFTKKLFFFKDVEGNHLDINKRYKQIEQLINLTELSPNKISPNNSILDKSKEIKNKLTIETEMIKDLNNNEIKIYNEKIDKRIKEKEEKEKESSMEKKSDNKIQFIRNKKKIKIRIEKKRIKQRCKEKEENNNNFQSLNLTPSRSNISSGIRLNRESNLLVAKYNLEKNKKKEITKLRKIKYTYNVFEIIISSFLYCCMYNNLKIKKDITEKSNNILYSKLDIIVYIKNMILLDIINEALLNNNRKNIIKFLSRPIISINRKEDNYLNDFYNNYYEDDFDNFYLDVFELVQKTGKRETEKQLIFLSNQQLKKLIYN